MKLYVKASYKFALIISFILQACTGVAQQNDTILLYQGAIPNSKPTPADYKEITDKNGNIIQVSIPTLLSFFPEKGKASGTAIIVCPGGAYSFLAYQHEGVAIAKKYAEAGVTAFVLKYRLPSDKIMTDRSIGPLQDAQRAIQLVRENAVKWGIDPAKVGIAGFSAGGHLAATAATHYDAPVIPVKSGISVRPDFAILIYPVISMGVTTHQGSKENLIGAKANQKTIDLFSNEKQVKADVPPLFLMHCQDDDIVDVKNSLLFYEALLAKKIVGAMNIYQSGGHGFGLNNATTNDYWFDRCASWMKQNKFN